VAASGALARAAAPRQAAAMKLAHRRRNAEPDIASSSINAMIYPLVSIM
jgi:hypothetical protein